MQTVKFYKFTEAGVEIKLVPCQKKFMWPPGKKPLVWQAERAMARQGFVRKLPPAVRRAVRRMIKENKHEPA